jgi:hypothetical protein
VCAKNPLAKVDDVLVTLKELHDEFEFIALHIEEAELERPMKGSKQMWHTKYF